MDPYLPIYRASHSFFISTPITITAGMQAVWLNPAQQAWPHDTPPHATVASLTELCRLLDAPAAPFPPASSQ